MNKNDIKDRINAINTRLNEMVSACEKEERKLTESEETEKKALLEERTALDGDLTKITNNTNFIPMEEKKNNFSLIEAIRSIVNGGRFEGDYADEVRSLVNKSGLSYAGQIQMKAGQVRSLDGILTAGNDYAANSHNGGKEMIATDVLPIIDALYNQTCLEKGGAMFYNGLVGDAKIPIIGTTTFGFKAENAAADTVTPTMSKVTLSPQRLTGEVIISKQLLNQTSQDLEYRLRLNIAKGVAQAIEKAILGDGTSPHNGLLAGSPTEVTQANLTYAVITAMEASVKNANFSPSFVCDATVSSILKQRAKLPYGNQAVMQDGRIDGLQTFETGNIGITGGNGLACVDFSQLHVGTWGDLLDIVVDPLTRAKYGEIVLTLNYYCDWAWAFSTAYAVRKVTE